MKDVCVGANVSRKTFYSHFEDKDAIVDRVFRRDVIQPLLELGRLLSNDEVLSLIRSVLERMFKAVRDDGDYYHALVAPMRGNDFTFNRIAIKALYDYYASAFKRFGQPLDTLEGNYTVSYFASAQTALIEKWICEGYPASPAQLAKLYDDVALPYWKKLSNDPPPKA